MQKAAASLYVHEEQCDDILLIPGRSSMEHLRENVAGACLQLPHEAIKELNAIAS
jgi:pyridoxine 4-dehydrogenase